MNLIEKINAISKEAKNQFKPDLVKYGKNFRAISESAVLEVLNPLFEKYGIVYEVEIKNCNLQIENLKAGSDRNGNAVEQALYIANCVISLHFFHNEGNNTRVLSPEEVISFNPFETLSFEGWGMGVDFGDKATGKAITGAVKYALFKGLRLQYSDDPDAEESKPIESVADKKTQTKEEEPLVTEKMLNYIKSLCISLGISDEDFKKRFKYTPYSSTMPMRVARDAIDKLKAEEKERLPF